MWCVCAICLCRWFLEVGFGVVLAAAFILLASGLACLLVSALGGCLVFGVGVWASSNAGCRVVDGLLVAGF